MPRRTGADILVRVHANGDLNQSVYGALTMAPSSRNTYLPVMWSARSRSLPEDDRSIRKDHRVRRTAMWIYTDSMSGINWSTIPVTIIELGFEEQSFRGPFDGNRGLPKQDGTGNCGRNRRILRINKGTCLKWAGPFCMQRKRSESAWESIGSDLICCCFSPTAFSSHEPSAADRTA